MDATDIFAQNKLHRLYLICDGDTCDAHGITRIDFMQGALQGGARIIQYRDKHATPENYERNLMDFKNICAAAGATLIANDHAQLAEKHQIAVHIGQQDQLPAALSVQYGRSTHSIAELELALACQPSPTYVALGTMFASPTKPDVKSARHLVTQFLAMTALPIVLIGGINIDNAATLPVDSRLHLAVISDAFRFGTTASAITEYVKIFLGR